MYQSLRENENKLTVDGHNQRRSSVPPEGNEGAQMKYRCSVQMWYTSPFGAKKEKQQRFFLA